MVDPNCLEIGHYKDNIADVLYERSTRVGTIERKIEPSPYYLASVLRLENGHTKIVRMPGMFFSTESDAKNAIAKNLEAGAIHPPGTRE